MTLDLVLPDALIKNLQNYTTIISTSEAFTEKWPVILLPKKIRRKKTFLNRFMYAWRT